MNRLMVFVVMLISIGVMSAIAQPCTFPVFDSGNGFGTGDLPRAVAAGDVNNDSKPDVVVANFNDSTISVLLGDGAGSFQPKIDSPAGSGPIAVYLKHLNGDGFLDAVVLNQRTSPNSVVSLTGNGAGQFSIAAQYEVYNPFSARIFDANGDGHLDIALLSGDSFAGRIFIYPGNGNAQFGAPTEYTVPNGITGAFEAADFDADGVIDLAYSNTSGIYVWKGSGSGTFAPNWSWTQNYGSLTAGNFDGNSSPDLAILDSFNGVRLFTNNGNGTFTRRDSFPVGEVAGASTAADLNHDGIDDFVTSNFASNEASVLISNGDGTFRSTVNYTTVGESRGIAVADFDGDSHPDLVTAGPRINLTTGRENQIRLVRGRGDGTFIAPINHPIFQDAFPNAVEIADFTSDGRDDVVIANSSVWGISLYTRIGAFRFSDRRNYLPSTYINHIAVGDFNTDGRRDIAAVGGSLVHILLGDGLGGFTSAPTFATAGFSVHIGTADLNNDQIADLVVGVRDGARFSVYFGVGNGTFTTPNDYSVGIDPVYDIGIADFNGDSRPDLAVIFETGTTVYGRVRIYLNNGVGSFSGGAEYSVGVSIHPNAIAIGDFNADGRQDFTVTTDYDPNSPARAWIFIGTGNGTFASTIQYPVEGWHPNDVIARDFNNDGKIDIATTNEFSENVSVFSGGGNGTFSLNQQPSVGEQSRRMASGNLNSDNSPDIVVTNYNGSSFTIIPNGCNRAAEQTPRAPFDFDGDGKTDFAIYRPAVGQWWVRNSGNGIVHADAFGNSSDRIVPGDFTGDGRADVAVFRPSDGNWYILRSENSTYYAVPFGTSEDRAVPADFDGDGVDDIAVFRPTNATWYVSNSSGGTTITQFGLTSDRPVPADFDGDGRSDIAVFRPESGEWWIALTTGGTVARTFGSADDRALPADYTGDGLADIAVFRPSSGTWYIMRSENLTFYSFPFGIGTDLPAPGDYDGDGRIDAAVFRPSESNWYVNRSTGGSAIRQFGLSGDLPVPGAFVR